MNKGEIKIDPFIPEIQLDKKKNILWLRVGNEYKVFRHLCKFKEPINIKDMQKYTESKKVDKKIIIPSNDAILLKSLEKVVLSDKFIARVEPKQIMGLSMNTFTIEPGFSGQIEILVWNRAPFPVSVDVGEGIVSLAVYKKD
jgi:deoxycytidine triphosphate deaminase